MAVRPRALALLLLAARHGSGGLIPSAAPHQADSGDGIEWRDVTVSVRGRTILQPTLG
jgi:hypothetical protein